MQKVSTIHFTAIDSTNSWAKTNTHLLDPDKITRVSADIQHGGRGRGARKWVSPAKQNMTTSFCFFVGNAQKDLHNVGQIMALSAARVLEELGFHPRLKWPNDIYLSQKKVGGILCETAALDDQICVIIGIGLNVNMPGELTEQIDQPATSLYMEKGTKFDVNEITAKLTDQFAKDIGVFFKEGFAPFLVEYSARLAHSAKQALSFHDHGTLWEGTFHSLNADGSLNLQLPSGDLKCFYSGEAIMAGT